MAKKGQAVQLQSEINSDDEWDRMMERRGLIVIDIYSDWCGPCAAMAANLKKLKLEIGGDNLLLAIAKCDNIKCLERFRGKSEPTWMFVSGGKMVNLMFGSNAPKLIALITSELKRDQAARSGQLQRNEIAPGEMSEEEQVRYDVKESAALAAQQAEQAAEHRRIDEHRTAEAEHFLETVADVGVILSFPHCKDKALDVLHDALEAHGLSIEKKEKPLVREKDMDLLFYFADGFRFPDHCIEHLCSQKTMAWTVRGGQADTIEEVLQKIVYGPSGQYPGDPDSPAEKLQLVKEPPPPKEDEDPEGTREPLVIIGIWTPMNRYTKANAIKVLCPIVAGPLHIPEPEPIPPHIAMVFDAFKRQQVLGLADEYPVDVMRFGFFSNDDPTSAKLLAKSQRTYEKRIQTEFGEKLVIQLSKKRSDPVLAFAQLGPTYMSTNAVDGAKECKMFFPEGYDEPEPVEEEPVVEVKKKKKKKQAVDAEGAAVVPDEGSERVEGDEATIAEEGEEGAGEDGAEEGDDVTVLSGDAHSAVPSEEERRNKENDKATSPMEPPVEPADSTSAKGSIKPKSSVAGDTVEAPVDGAPQAPDDPATQSEAPA